jgi:hypothetical protein
MGIYTDGIILNGVQNMGLDNFYGYDVNYNWVVLANGVSNILRWAKISVDR